MTITEFKAADFVLFDGFNAANERVQSLYCCRSLIAVNNDVDENINTLVQVCINFDLTLAQAGITTIEMADAVIGSANFYKFDGIAFNKADIWEVHPKYLTDKHINRLFK